MASRSIDQDVEAMFAMGTYDPCRALEAQAEAALNASALRSVQDRLVALRDREAGIRRDRKAAAAAVAAAEAEFNVYAKAYRKASGKSTRGRDPSRRLAGPRSRPSGGLA